MASGGVNERGSLRNVQIIRNGAIVKTVDLYEFLMKGNVAQGVFLKAEDVLHVPMSGPQNCIGWQGS